MSGREKIILFVIGGLVGLGVLYMMVNSVHLKPLRELNDRIANHRKNLSGLDKRNGREANFNRRYDGLLKRSHAGGYDGEGLKTKRMARERLRALVTQCGLSESTLDMRASSGAKSSDGRFSEVAWTVRTSGKLEQLTNFLYAIEQQPYLQRIESMVAAPDWKNGTATLTFKYVTPAFWSDKKARKAKSTTTKPAATQPATAATPAPVDFNTPERKKYDAIVTRDLFRPYMKKPAPKPAPAPKPTPRSTPKPTTPVRPTTPPSTDQYFKIVGLPRWSSDPAKATVLVTDTRNQQTVEHALGGDLAGGKIAWIDYRPMPSAANAEILSPSRVIVKIGSAHWAVELGQTLSTKRQLKEDQLPVALRPKPPVKKEVVAPKKLTSPAPVVPAVKETAKPAPSARPAPMTQPTPASATTKPAPTTRPSTQPALRPASQSASQPVSQPAPATPLRSARGDAQTRAKRLALFQQQFRQRTLMLNGSISSETNDYFQR